MRSVRQTETDQGEDKIFRTGKFWAQSETVKKWWKVIAVCSKLNWHVHMKVFCHSGVSVLDLTFIRMMRDGIFEIKNKCRPTTLYQYLLEGGDPKVLLKWRHWQTHNSKKSEDRGRLNPRNFPPGKPVFSRPHGAWNVSSNYRHHPIYSSSVTVSRVVVAWRAVVVAAWPDKWAKTPYHHATLPTVRTPPGCPCATNSGDGP